MALIAFSTKYGELGGVAFASAWKKNSITVEQGKNYEFMMKKGVVVDCREV